MHSESDHRVSQATSSQADHQDTRLHRESEVIRANVQLAVALGSHLENRVLVQAAHAIERRGVVKHTPIKLSY